MSVPNPVQFGFRPRLLDLFCGAGGAAMGYHRAGFDVVGVDIRPQPHYPFEFHQGDAMEWPLEGYDAIHASPPCQQFSRATLSQRMEGKIYPDLVAGTRGRLVQKGLPWVIENVPGAPIRADIKLCGCLFGLRLRRIRWFETSWNAFQLISPCVHLEPPITVVGHGTPSWVRRRLGFNITIRMKHEAMDITWMNRNELSEAVPPAYTQYVGGGLLPMLERVT